MKHLLHISLLLVCLVLSSRAQQSANIVFIGNSITYGALHQQRELTAPPVRCGAWLSAQDGIDTVYVANCGRSGRTTYHFLPVAADVIPAGDKTYYPDVVQKARQLVKAHPGLPLIFSIMLGTNDSVERKHNSHTTPANYAANLVKLINALLSEFPDAHFVLNKPIWYKPDYVTKGGSVASKSSLRLLDDYAAQFDAVAANCKQGRVHKGDSLAFGYFKKNRKSDIFKEQDARGKSYWLHPNEQGAIRLAQYWGQALLPVIRQAASYKARLTHDLQGKRIGFIGDSYVRNHREPVENTWHYKFATKYGMRYYNYGRNGNCIALDLKQWGTAMYKRYAEMNDSLDYIVIIAGHNDASNGRLDSIGIDVFKERLAMMLSGLRQKYPEGKVLFFTPWRCDNFDGSSRQRVIDATKEVCQRFDVPVFDAAREGNILADSEEFRKKYFQGGKGTDTAHLNNRGHDLFLPVAEEFLLEHIAPSPSAE